MKNSCVWGEGGRCLSVVQLNGSACVNVRPGRAAPGSGLAQVTYATERKGDFMKFHCKICRLA